MWVCNVSAVPAETVGPPEPPHGVLEPDVGPPEVPAGLSQWPTSYTSELLLRFPSFRHFVLCVSLLLS